MNDLDDIDRDFAPVDPEALRQPGTLLDEVTGRALRALDNGYETKAPLLAVLVDVARLRLTSEVSRG